MKMDFKLESRQLIWDYLLLTVGALLTAFAFAAFFVTNDIAPGGVTGIATVLSSVTGLNVALLSFLINVPLFASGGGASAFASRCARSSRCCCCRCSST